MKTHFHFARVQFSAFLLLVSALVLSGVTSPAALAQTFRGAIHGSVTDAANALVTSAYVTAKNKATALGYATLSSNSGVFSFQDLPIGSYTVTVHKAGFRDTVADNVPVEAGSVYELTVPLAVASAVNAVEVTANAVAVETSTVTQSNVLDAVTVEGVPLNTELYDLINSGSTGAAGTTQFTIGGGLRSRLAKNLDLGVAYEAGIVDPVGIFGSRVTADVIWRF